MSLCGITLFPIALMRRSSDRCRKRRPVRRIGEQISEQFRRGEEGRDYADNSSSVSRESAQYLSAPNTEGLYGDEMDLWDAWEAEDQEEDEGSYGSYGGEEYVQESGQSGSESVFTVDTGGGQEETGGTKQGGGMDTAGGIPNYEEFDWLRTMFYKSVKSKEYFPDLTVIREPSVLEGDWKIYITDDTRTSSSSESVRLMNGKIHTEGNEVTLTLTFVKLIFNDTGEEIMEDDRVDTVLTGKWSDDMQISRLQNDYLTVQLNQFFTAGGKQYGVAAVKWISGEQDVMGLMRE